MAEQHSSQYQKNAKASSNDTIKNNKKTVNKKLDMLIDHGSSNDHKENFEENTHKFFFFGGGYPAS